jgi:hypothetical protein
MPLSRKAIETLVDLVEIKLSCLEVYDREDSRELVNLQQCRDELTAQGKIPSKTTASVIAIDSERRRGARQASA